MPVRSFCSKNDLRWKRSQETPKGPTELAQAGRLWAIQQETGGDRFEIAPATPYTNDYTELLDIPQQEQSGNARPELAGQVENWEQYDTIFVGYPNWWSDAPMAVYTFVESYDWDGNTLVPFNTSASGGFGRSLSGLEESASGAAILEGISFTERTLGDAQGEVAAWLDELGL